MRTMAALVGALLLAAGAAWIWVAIRKYAARKQAEAAREAAFIAELMRAPPVAAPAAPESAAAPAVAPAAAPADPVEAASRKIKDALARGRGNDAVAAFSAALEYRARLALSPAEWSALGRLLLAQGAFLEAAWSLHAGAALAGDALAAQKCLVEVAGRAAAAGQPQAALKLYATLLEKYPATEYAPFVRASVKAEERKLKG